MRTSLSNNPVLSSTLIFSLLGMMLGYMVMAILSSIAMPKLTSAYMTKEMYSLIVPPDSSLLFLGTEGVWTASFVLLAMVAVLYMIWMGTLFSGLNIIRRPTLKSLLFLLLFIFSVVALFLLSLTYFSETKEIDALSLLALQFSAIFLALFSAQLIDQQRGADYVGIRTLLLTAFFGVVAYGLYFGYLSTVAQEFFKALFALGSAGEATIAGWQKMYVIMILAGALSGGFFGALLTWMLRSGSLNSLSIVVIIAVMTVCGGEYFRSYTAERLEMKYSTINEAAGLVHLPESKTAKTILFFDGSEKPDLKSLPIRVTTMSTPKQTVDLLPENRDKLWNYIDKNHYTYHTENAMFALLEMEKQNWDLNAYRKAAFHVVRNNGGIIHGLLLLASAERMPVTEANLAFLTQLSDESLFEIRGNSAYRLAKSWISFGDEERARHLYKKAGEVSSPRGYEPFETLLERGRFNSGKISGRVVGAVEGAKIALVATESPLDLSQGFSFIRIKAVRTLSEGGRFSFDHLVAGNYMLALLLPETSAKISSVTGGGVYTVDSNRSSLDALELRVW